ncbi:hypothetical protein AB4Z10_13375 [Bosea sp. RAF48]|uniref:hypothetical protein n=1 Tax=Bosea sp. RAF48 TaxID=3237480 RepID=UPI003F8F61BE
MRNNYLDDWLDDADYFSNLAVLSNGPLHPGGLAPNKLLASRLDWNNVCVLDLGAGTGLSHRFFTALGARVQSVEPNTWMRRAAVRAGVDPNKIFACSAEEISASWLKSTLDDARLVIQGVTGFLSKGLETLAPIMAHPSIAEVVMVEWIGSQVDYGQAPVRHSYNAADYVAAAEQAGFGNLWLETFRYAAPDNGLCEVEAEGRIQQHFPEAREVSWSGALPLKLSSIRLSAATTKDYIVLIAHRKF